MSIEIFDWKKQSPELSDRASPSGAPTTIPRSYGLDLCNPEVVFTIEERSKLREDLAALALQRRLDAPSPADTQRIV